MASGEHGAPSGGSDWISRTLPSHVRCAGRMHEQKQHTLPVRRLPVTIGHDVYAAERMAAKRGRTRAMLEAELAQRHTEGLTLAGRLLPDCAESPDFFFALGDLMVDLAPHEPARGAERLAVAQQAWHQTQAIGEQPDLVGAVPGRGSCLGAHNLAVVLEVLGDGAGAESLCSRCTLPRHGG